MEIRIGTIEDRYPDDTSLVKFLKKLSDREYSAINKALKEINDYKANKRLIEIVLLNNSELHFFFANEFEKLLNKSVSWLGVNDEDMEDIYLHSNRLLLNYLSSIRTYIDHTTMFLKRKYGKESLQIAQFEDLLSFNYDNNFCYRFFYKLRNFSQHCGVPIDNVSFTSEYDRDQNQIHGKLNAFFEPEKLLNLYKDWGRAVTNDLRMATDVIELRGLRESMTAIMFNLNVNFNRINKPQLLKAARYLIKKASHFKTENNQVCIFYNIQTRDNGEIMNFGNLPIPINEIENIIQSLTD